jgi:hypothetical protein
VKTTMIALSAAALIAAVPVAFAQSSQTPGLQHKVLKKRPPGVSGHASWHEVKARVSKKGYPGAFGYAPSEPRDYLTEMSRQAGGGGGGGGGM